MPPCQSIGTLCAGLWHDDVADEDGDDDDVDGDGSGGGDGEDDDDDDANTSKACQSIGTLLADWLRPLACLRLF